MRLLQYENIYTFYVNLIGVFDESMHEDFTRTQICLNSSICTLALAICPALWLPHNAAGVICFFWPSAQTTFSLHFHLSQQGNKWEVSAVTLPLMPSLLITFPCVLSKTN